MTIRVGMTAQPMPVKFHQLVAQNNELTHVNDSHRLQHFIIDGGDFSLTISDTEGNAIKADNTRTFILPLNATVYLKFLVQPKTIVMMEL